MLCGLIEYHNNVNHVNLLTKGNQLPTIRDKHHSIKRIDVKL